MKDLFAKRRQGFYQTLGKYLPYVFNDHFVLVLMVGLGAGLYQYRQLLRHFPKDTWLLYLILSGLALLSLTAGRVATYVLPADQHYLLAQELALSELVKQATKRACLFWAGVEGLLVLLYLPILLKLGWGFWSILLLTFVLILAKVTLIRSQAKTFYTETGGLRWSKLIQQEQARQQAILRFFALFTTVKGLSTTLHRRPWLKPLLSLVKVGQGRLYHNLFWRALLRSGDYLGLVVRLTGLALFSLIGVSQPLLAVGLAVLFNFLLVFQLIGLYQHYNYQALLLLVPQPVSQKKRALRQFLQVLLALLLLVQLPLTKSWLAALLLGASQGILAMIYLPAKVRSLD